MDENYSKSNKEFEKPSYSKPSNEEKQVFLSESEELSKDEPPADFDISVEELTAKLAEKKLVEERAKEEKISLEAKDEIKPFQIQMEEEKPKSFSIKIEEDKHEEHHAEQSFVSEPIRHKPTFNHKKTFLQRYKWLVLFTVLLVASYFWFHPADNNLVSSYTVDASVGENSIKETVREIPQTPAVEKIDLRQEKLRSLILDGVNS